jgi:hypothetical protein
MNPTADEREAFLKKAGEIYDRIVGVAGPELGESFDQIEERVEAAGRELQRALLGRRLAAETQAEPQAVPCPQCGQPMRRPAAPVPRHLDTCSGPVVYARRHAICDRCGKSFSPAGPSAGHPGPGGVQPPGA